MGVFDKLTDALSGKPTKPAPKSNPSGTKTGSADFSDLARVRDLIVQERKQGFKGDGHTTSSVDKAMQDHADKLHPTLRR